MSYQQQAIQQQVECSGPGGRRPSIEVVLSAIKYVAIGGLLVFILLGCGESDLVAPTPSASATVETYGPSSAALPKIIVNRPSGTMYRYDVGGIHYATYTIIDHRDDDVVFTIRINGSTHVSTHSQKRDEFYDEVSRAPWKIVYRSIR